MRPALVFDQASRLATEMLEASRGEGADAEPDAAVQRAIRIEDQV